MEENHNWEFIKEVEDWIPIPFSNANHGTPRGILVAQLEKCAGMLQESKDRLIVAQRKLEKLK